MGDSIWNNFLDETMKERYELVAERIVEISKEPQVPECYKDYFSEAAAYLEKTMELCQMAIAGTLQQRSLEMQQKSKIYKPKQWNGLKKRQK